MIPAAVLAILVKADTRQAKGELARMNTQLESTGKTGSKAASRIAAVGKVGAVGLAGGLVYAVKKAADFEQQMDRLGSVSEANRQEMKRFERQAMQAGLATKFSALEAAAAQTELAKGGLTIKQIMGGGLKSALALAAAGEMELADAATATVNAMKLFGLRGSESMKVADGFAKAANATTADVKDFTMALSQGGGAARAAGYDFRETVVVLEALAEIGVKNSDAGTSLKTTFAQLASPTKIQKEAMKGLNLEFFNAEGNMKRASVISQMLRDRTEGLTREQRLNAFSTLAGTDGMRTLLALYEAGPKKLEKYRKGLEEQGTAAEVAREKQNNFKGALENLQGSIETIGISIGTKLLPPLTKFIKRITRILSAEDLTGAEKFEKFIDLIVEQIEAALPKLVEAVKTIAPKVASAFWGAFKDLPVGGQILTAAVIGKVLFGGDGSRKTFKTVGSTSAGGFAAGFLAQMKGAAGASMMNIVAEKMAAKGGATGFFGKFLSARGQTFANPLFVKEVAPIGAPGAPGGPGKTILGSAKEVATGAGAAVAATRGKALMAGAKKIGGFLVKRAIPGIGVMYTTIEVADALGLMDKEARATPQMVKATTGAKPKPRKELEGPGATTGARPRRAGDIQERGGWTGLGLAQRDRTKAVKDEAASAAAAGMEQLNKRLKVVREAIRKLRDSATMDISAIQKSASRNFKTIGDDIGLHTRKGKNAAGANLEAAATAIGKSVLKGKTSTKQAMAAVEALMRTHSKIGKERLSKNLADAADNVRKSMKEGKTSTREGMRLIEHYMVRSLMTMGFTKKQALLVRKGQDPYTGKATGGDQNLTNKQRGGPVTGGLPTGDSVPILGERGEYMLNRKAVEVAGKRNLDMLNFGIAPRGMQAGGMVRVPGDPDTTGGRDKVAASIANEVAGWIKRYKIQIGYAFDPGGGHVSPGHNVSGTALDVVPGIGGSWDTLEAGLKAAVAAGKTVYYGTNGIGQVLENHGRGNHGHVEWASSAGGVGGSVPGLELGKKLKRLIVEGPDSLLKANVQGALDIARGGANAVVDRANKMVSASLGSFSGADFAGGGDAAANRALGKRMAEAFAGWGHGEQWDALDKLWIGESGWINQMNQAGSGATGIPQALPGNKMASEGADWATNPATQIAWGLKYIRDTYTNPVGAYGAWLSRSPHWYAKGGPVGYVGDSLGVGTSKKLKGILDRAVFDNVESGRPSKEGPGILKAYDKATQLVFDLGTNDPNAAATHSSLLAASRVAGKRPLHFFSLLGGPDVGAKNKMFRNAAGPAGHEYLVDAAQKLKGKATDSIGHFSDSGYAARARLLAESIRGAGEDEGTPFGFDPSGISKGKPGTLARGIYQALSVIRGSDSKKIRGRTLKGLKKLIGGFAGIDVPDLTGITKLQDKQAREADFATRALGLSEEKDTTNLGNLPLDQLRGVAATHWGRMSDRQRGLMDLSSRSFEQLDEGALMEVLETPIWGTQGGKSEIEWLESQFETLRRLRNLLIKTEGTIITRREAVKRMIDRAQKRLDEIKKEIDEANKTKQRLEKALDRVKDLRGDDAPKKARAIVAGLKNHIPDNIWKALHHAVGMKEKPVQHLKDSMTNQLDLIEDRQVARRRERGGLNVAIPALIGRRKDLTSALTETIQPALFDVQGYVTKAFASKRFPDFPPYEAAAASGDLGGSVFDVHQSLRALGIKKILGVAEAEAPDTSARDDLLKEIGRLTVLRTAVEDIHAVTLRDFPQYDRLGVPYGGAFAEGGVVPGPIGAPRVILAHGGETVTPPSVTPIVEINFASGMEWLERFIDVRVDGATRRIGRGAGRRLPGAGGGSLG